MPHPSEFDQSGHDHPPGGASGTNDQTAGSRSSETFAMDRADVLVLGLILTGIGVALGFFLPAIGSFAAKFPIPFGEVIEKLSQFDQAWVVIVRPIIGVVLGLIATFFIVVNTANLTIKDVEIVVDRHDNPLRISKESFSTAYFDGGKLVILTQGGHQAFKGDIEGKKKDIAAAFADRGYKWGEI